METLTGLLREAVATYGDHPALSIRAGLRVDTWSYRRLWAASGTVGRYLRHERGLAAGGRVLVWAPNSPHLVAAYFGAMLARLVLVPLDPLSTPDFVQRVAEKTRASALIAAGDAPAIPGVPVVRLLDLPFGLDGPGLDEEPGADDLAEVVFTSGTTGNPKGVMLTHGNIIANVRSVSRVIPRRPDYRLLSILPLSHMLEQTIGLYLPLSYGSTVCYSTSRQSAALQRLLRRHRVNTMVVVPQVLDLMLKGIERGVRRRGQWERWQRVQGLAGSLPLMLRRWLFRGVHRELGGCLDLIVCGGAYLPPALAQSWERLGVRVVQGYGATECSPVIAAQSLHDRVPGSVGRLVPGVELRQSEEGELLVKGPNVTSGYWEDPGATQAAFTGDGFYRTGDLVEMDASGRISLKGRLKDVIVLASGLNVYPEDVERALVSEEGVADCVVLSLPGPSGSPRVHAVVLPEGEGDRRWLQGRVEAAVSAANRRLASHQQIGGFSLWPGSDFPRTNSLKVKRHEVRALLGGTSPAPAAAEGAAAASTDERLARLQRLLASVSGVRPEAIEEQTELQLHLGLDSLARVELVVLMEEELGVAIDEEELAGARTVAHLLGLLERGEAAGPPLTTPAWALGRTARLARGLLQQTLVFPSHRLVSRPFGVEGLERLSEVALPALFIANHSSHLDAPSVLRALPASIRRRIAVAAAADYFYSDPRLGFAVSVLLNAFPFSRRGSVRASLEYCGELVDAGWSILIYPEGTRSATGRLQPFKSGIGLLAAGLRVPVVPVAVLGAYQMLPKGAGWPRPGAVTVCVGEPLMLPPACGHPEATALLEAALARLLDAGPARAVRAL